MSDSLCQEREEGLQKRQDWQGQSERGTIFYWTLERNLSTMFKKYIFKYRPHESKR